MIVGIKMPAIRVVRFVSLRPDADEAVTAETVNRSGLSLLFLQVCCCGVSVASSVGHQSLSGVG